MARTRLVLAATLTLAALLACGAAAHAGLRVARAHALWRREPVPVLIYHLLVAPGAYTPQLRADRAAMTVEQFAAEMDYLAAAGYHPLHLAAFLAARAGQGGLPSRPVLITFDDGYAATVKLGYPVLARHGFPATVFLITGRVGEPGGFYLDWSQVRATASLIDYEAHTAKLHYAIDGRPAMEVEPDDAVLADLSLARQTMARELGQPPLAFAYPFGQASPRTARLVSAAGFRAAFVGEGDGRLPPATDYTLPRFPVPPGMSLLDFRAIALGEEPRAGDWLSLLGETFAGGAHRLAVWSHLAPSP